MATSKSSTGTDAEAAGASLSLVAAPGSDKTTASPACNWYEDAVCMLRDSGRKLTRQRRVVLHLFDCDHRHLTAQQVHESVIESQPDISLVTIYRTLELMTDLGILSKINFNDGADRYERNLGDAGHHHHLICTECGRVVEFLGCAIPLLTRQLEEATGFAIDGHWLKLTGQCAPCQTITPGACEEE